MRRVLLPAVAVAVLTLPAPAPAQQVRYWPLREIGFPVPPDVLRLDPKPAKLRLYSAPAGGRFEPVAERAANALDPIDNRPPGFKYTAKADGEEEFAVQLVYDNGTVSPQAENLRPEFRVVFDTRPPSVQLAANGRYGVEWSAADDNLDPESVRLECRWAGERKWYAVKTRNTLRARDGYTWDSLAREARSLEVRVVARDKAENEGVSRIVTLPAAGAAGGLRDDPLTGRIGGDLAGTGRPAGDDIPGQPAIVYVNTNQLTIKSKLMHVTRSGVKAVHLFVKDVSAGPTGEWRFAKKQECNIAYEDAGPQVEIPFVAPQDGRYGFIVIPESGVGKREPDPRPNSPAQQLVEVDTVKPTVKIRNVLVSPGGAIGPRVEVEWDADDRNMMPDPIVLEYRDATKPGGAWASIAEKVPNSRRYVWEVADKSLYKFVVRIRAVDKASNTGEHVYEKEVIIDLDRPSATIDSVRPSGAPLPQTAEKPTITPTRPDPPPAKTPDPGGLQLPPLLPGK